MDENKISKELEMYSELVKKDPNINVASLMMNALKHEQGNQVPDKQKHWAYLISVGVPPFGLLFALKFYFSDATDGKKIAYICIALTAATILTLIIITQMLISASGVDTQELQQIKPQDIQQLLE